MEKQLDGGRRPLLKAGRAGRAAQEGRCARRTVNQRFNEACDRPALNLGRLDRSNQGHWWTDIDIPGRRSQDHVQRKNHAVLIVHTRVVVTGLFVSRRVMCVGVRMGDHVVVAVRTSCSVDVLHRRQRQYADGQTD